MKTRIAVCCLMLCGFRPDARADSFVEFVLRFTGIAANPGSLQKGSESDIRGEIWMVDLATSKALRVCEGASYLSPIFAPGDEAILALEEDALWRFDLKTGKRTAINAPKGLIKLLAVDGQRVLVLFRGESKQITAGLIDLKSGNVESATYDEASAEDRRMLTHLLGWERAYGDIRLFTKSQRRDGMAGPEEWKDVHIQKAGQQPSNVSNGDGTSCGQPSLSRDGKRVVFIKAHE